MYIQAIGSGIGIYSGLFQVTPVSEFIDTFIVVIGAIILIGWAPVTSKVVAKVDSVSTALPIIPEYPLLILFTVSGASFLISRSRFSFNVFKY
jgi:NADH-ubiquinone oxidoreductase chain 2